MEGIAQKHRRRENRPERVRDALPCDVGRTAVNRLKETRPRADGRGRHQTDRAADDRRLIGEDVAKQVARHDHIELRRTHSKLHGAVVDVEMIERDIAVPRCKRRHRTPPETRGREHVRLVHGRDLATSKTRRLECETCDALHLGDGVVLHVPRTLRTVHLLGLALLSEVDAADQLAHDDEVDTAHEFQLQRRVLDQCVRDLHGAQVRIETEPLAESQNRTLRAQGRLHTVPLRPADCAEEHTVRCLADREGVLGQRRAEFIVCRTTRVACLVRQPE